MPATKPKPAENAQTEVEDTPVSPNLRQRLLAITKEASVTKGGTAPGNIGGFAYHKIDDVEAALSPLFVSHGVLASVDVTDMETEIVPTGKKNAYVSKATVEISFWNIESDNPKPLVIRSRGRGIDYADKSEGKAISYACKNAYLSLFHLKGQADNESDAHEEHVPAPRQSGNGRTITEKQQRRLFALAKENGWKPDDMKKWLKIKFGYEHSNDIPMAEYDAVVEFFTAESPQSAQDAKATADLDAISEPPADEGFAPPADEVPF